VKIVKWSLSAVVLLAVGAAIGAALDGGTTKPEGAAAKLARTPTPTPTPEGSTAKRAKKKVKARAAATPTPTPTVAPAPPTFVACDPNIRARTGTTTCPFAENVFYEYWYSSKYDELSAFAAYSPAAGRWFDITCHGSGTVSCRAGDGAEVRFPMSAVTAYTLGNARAYAAHHTVSTGPVDEAEPDYGDPSSDGDLDCSDIPETDFPTPPGDPDGLDADGDGIACES
jgi:hypothetical protein